jgi:hypothetical protein
MGVLTSLYSVPAPLMKKIRADNEKLGFVFGDEEADDDSWKVAAYDFDKQFYDAMSLYKSLGHKTIHAAFNFEDPADDEPEYGGYDIRVAKPAMVKRIAEELSKLTFSELKTRGLAEGATNYSGNTVQEYEYDGLVGSVDRLKAFFATAAAKGHFVIAAAA